jgi:hypothetical protein
MSGLTNIYLQDVIGGTCETFIGVFSCDELQDIPPQNQFSLVCNFSPSNMKGTHFIALYVTASSTYYFDSYGLPCIDPEINKFVVSLNRAKNYSSAASIQDMYSTFCGYYCWGFILSMEQNNNVSYITHFNRKRLKDKNDIKCIKFIQSAILKKKK